MKTVKELCLGVAVAGVVAGAGTALGCAVALADPSAETGNDTGRAAAETPNAGPATAQARNRGSARQAGDSAPQQPSRAAAAQRAAIHTDRGASRDAVNVVATDAPPPAAAAPRPAPAAPLTPVAPLPLPMPTPVVPAAPAGAVTVSVANPGRASRTVGALAQAAVLADPPTHVLLIGTDGTNLDKILANPANTGFFNLMDESITGAASIVGHTTISGPSWSTILTGAWDNKTGVINNLFNPAPYNSWPTVFNLIEYNKPTVTTALFANWQYMNDIGDAGGYPADINEFVGFDTSWEKTDDLVVDETIALINATSAAASTFVFSYQVAVDEAGHAFGGGSPEYAAAVTNTSNNVQRIMDAVNAWEVANPGQEWTVIVTTDHGHQQSVGFGHGFQSPAETSTFVMFDLEGDGANDGTQNLAYSNADITPTIVSLFGIAQRSDFDGVPLQSKASTIVAPDDLSAALVAAVNTFGYPNVGDDIALGVRTVFTSIPYFLNGFVNTATGFLQGVVDQDIFLISALAGVLEVAVQFTGDLLVGVTQAIARVVATLTGSGVIPPSNPPLPPAPTAALTPAILV